MRVYCCTPFSICLTRTYQSPSALALFQSRGWDSTTLTYSAMAASTFPNLMAFSAFFNAVSRSNGGTGYCSSKISDNVIKQGCRPERPTVLWRIAKPCNRRQVVRRGISLMSVVTVSRVSGVEGLHQPIPSDFRDDRGRRNGGGAPIALDDASLRHRQ